MTTATTPTTAVSRKPLFTFLIIVSILSALIYLLAFGGNGENAQGGLALLQFSPAVAAIVTKLIYQRNLRGLGWKWGKTRYQLISLVLPFFIGLVSFSLVWLLGFGGFSSGPFIAEAQAGIAESFGLNIRSVVVLYFILIVLNSSVGLLLPAIFAFGEELGWRGFLVPELDKHVSFTKTGFISGIIWTVFHYPLLIGMVAPQLDISVWPLLITAMIGGVSLSIILAWLRLQSGSVWTAVIFHAALNAHNQGFFQNMTVETSSLTHYISGEYGLMLALVTAVVAYFFWRKRGSLPQYQAQDDPQTSVATEQAAVSSSV